LSSATTTAKDVYYAEEPGRRSAAKLLTRDEARRNRNEYRQAAAAIATTKRRGRKVKRPLPVSYQIYVAASAIKTATAMNNTTICTHRLLVSPPWGPVCVFILTSLTLALDRRQLSRFSDWPNEPAHRLCRSLIGKSLPRLWLDRPRQMPGRCIRSPGTGR
jgi:hypothetical protein